MKIRTLLGLITVLGLMAGCGSAPVKDPLPAERLDAAEYAIEKEYMLARLVAHCKSLSAETREHADRVQRQWWADYWPLIDAADKEYRSHVKAEQLKLGEKTGLLSALRYRMELSLKADNMIYRISKHQAYRDRRCVRALDEYSREDMALSADPLKYAHLKFLRGFYNQEQDNMYGSKIESPHPVPFIDSKYKAQRNAGGKSQYLVEKIVTRQLCSNFEILSLMQNGPLEVYGVYCDDQTNRLVTCDWGQCEIFKE